MASGCAQVIYDTLPDNAKRPIVICDVNQTPRWSEMWQYNRIILHPDNVFSPSNGREPIYLKNAPGCRPYIKEWGPGPRSIFNYQWQARYHVGRIYFNKFEHGYHKHRMNKFANGFILIEPNIGPKASPNKDWGFDKFHQVVQSMPNQIFVQVGPKGTRIIPEINVVHLETNNFRLAMPVLAKAKAIIAVEGGLVHAAAALKVPGVIIYGGFTDPKVVGYPIHKGLFYRLHGPACGLWSHCKQCDIAMKAITPMQVLDAYRSLKL